MSVLEHVIGAPFVGLAGSPWRTPIAESESGDSLTSSGAGWRSAASSMSRLGDCILGPMHVRRMPRRGDSRGSVRTLAQGCVRHPTSNGAAAAREGSLEREKEGLT